MISMNIVEMSDVFILVIFGLYFANTDITDIMVKLAQIPIFILVLVHL